MKQIVTALVLVCILMIVVNINTIDAVEEVMIENSNDKENNPWEKRPLIQTTFLEDEYLGAVRLGVFSMPLGDDKASQSLSETVSKCVVSIEMGQYAGNGLIWRAEEEGIVIAANKHLLQEAAYGTVILADGVSVSAEIMGYSQEYDLGFLFIAREKLDSEVFGACYEVRLMGHAVEYVTNQQIMQIASSQHTAIDRYEGVVIGTKFIPEFQVTMLETECYAKAGMSGGGVFDEKGYLLGMIAGGNVTEEDSVREAMVTYSIPIEYIEAEYQRIRESLK